MGKYRLNKRNKRVIVRCVNTSAAAQKEKSRSDKSGGGTLGEMCVALGQCGHLCVLGIRIMQSGGAEWPHDSGARGDDLQG